LVVLYFAIVKWAVPRRVEGLKFKATVLVDRVFV
ncbi:hypothetical protein L7F22_057761, partial [Adiantum nelumboides]|nr:hypothetical protein [Adiantum nelumboides]